MRQTAVHQKSLTMSYSERSRGRGQSPLGRTSLKKQMPDLVHQAAQTKNHSSANHCYISPVAEND